MSRAENGLVKRKKEGDNIYCHLQVLIYNEGEVAPPRLQKNVF